MKQFTLTLMALVCFWFVLPNQSQAQEFEQGTILVKAGIGVGDGYVANLGSIAIQGAAEYGVYDIEGIGNIGAGLRLGVRSESTNGADLSVFAVGPQATFHVTAIEIENLDLYGGFGIDFIRVKAEAFGISTSTSTSEFGVFAGANYFFSDNIAAFAELGLNRISIINAGIAFRF